MLVRKRRSRRCRRATWPRPEAASCRAALPEAGASGRSRRGRGEGTGRAPRWERATRAPPAARRVRGGARHRRRAAPREPPSARGVDSPPARRPERGPSITSSVIPRRDAREGSEGRSRSASPSRERVDDEGRKIGSRRAPPPDPCSPRHRCRARRRRRTVAAERWISTVRAVRADPRDQIRVGVVPFRASDPDREP